MLRILFFLLLLPNFALAFCGLYVSRADGDLFNEASKVVMVRDGSDTVITMSADYRGTPSEFAMVVPTPKVLKRDQIKVVDPSTITAIDAYSAPRLVEYTDEDPCAPPIVAMAMADDASPKQAERKRGADAFGVKVEAEYAIGEYDIVMLSARKSNGLVDYLVQEEYNFPDGAEEVLAGYIEDGMKFFVARVNLERHNGVAALSPLQLSFSSRNFMLPIRLGQVNAQGSQDLLLMTLTRKGRVQVQNYPMFKLHTDKEIPSFVRDRFGEFYKAMFTRTIDSIGGAGIVMEYAWDMAWCDPCAADPLTTAQLNELGVDWVSGDDPGQDVFVTRLHARYDERFTEDILLQETSDDKNFQGRYVMRVPYEGKLTCQSDYSTTVQRRTKEQADNLERLTGWPRRRIEEEIARTVPARFR